MIFRSTISSSDRSFRAYLDKWRNETGRPLFASLGDRSNVSSPRIENCQVAGRKKDQGSISSTSLDTYRILQRRPRPFTVDWRKGHYRVSFSIDADFLARRRPPPPPPLHRPCHG